MSKKPVYLRSKKRSNWLFAVLLVFVAWFFWGYEQESPLQMLVENSSLKGKVFQGKVKEIVSDKENIRAYFMEIPDSPLVTVSFIFDATGGAYDLKGKEGIASLTATTITSGAENITAQKFQDELRLNGINMSFNADRDVFSGHMTAPFEKVFEAALLFNKMIIMPRFEKKYVVTAKESAIKLLKTEKENPERVLTHALNHALYGAHPYGRRLIGNEESIISLMPVDLFDFVHQNLTKSHLFVGVSGNIAQIDAQKLLGEMFAGLPEGERRQKLYRPQLNLKQDVVRQSYAGGQNIAAFAMKGTCRKCDDFYPLYIANYLFGGAGLNSRLNQMMREKEGLTYGAYSVLDNENLADIIYAGFSATPDKYNKAVSLFKEELRRAASEGFTADELQAAKNYLTASYHLRFASTTSIAGMLAYMQKENLGIDFLQKRNSLVQQVTLEQVNKAARQYFGGDVLVAEIGSFEKWEE